MPAKKTSKPVVKKATTKTAVKKVATKTATKTVKPKFPAPGLVTLAEAKELKGKWKKMANGTYSAIVNGARYICEKKPS